MKNSHLVLISCLFGIILFYIALFIYTFINFDNEFKYSFKSAKNLNFHEKYSKKIHHIRDESMLNLLFKKPTTEDLLFSTINEIKNKKILFYFRETHGWSKLLSWVIKILFH